MSAHLASRLHADMVAAMKAHDKDRLSVVRMLLAAVQEEALKKRAALSDDDVLRVVMGYAKKREEAQAEARKAGRADLVASEARELELVRAYLPQPLSQAELDALVDAVAGELGAQSMADMGRVMKACLERAAGRADGARLSPLVRKRLAG